MVNEQKKEKITADTVKEMNYLPSIFRTIECTRVMDRVMINIVKSERMLFPKDFYTIGLEGKINEEDFLSNHEENIPAFIDAYFECITNSIKAVPAYKKKFIDASCLEDFKSFKEKESVEILQEVKKTYNKYYLDLKKYAKFDLAPPIDID